MRGWRVAMAAVRRSAGPMTSGPKGRRCLGAALIACGVMVIAPRLEGGAEAANLTRGCVQSFDAAADYFPDQVAVEDAINFTVEYRRSYKVVTVKEAYPGGPPERYVLAQCGAPAPRLQGDLAGAQLVTVPVTSLFCSSITHLPLLEDLGRVDVLTGVSRLTDLMDDAMQQRRRAGLVREFAPASVVDAELVVSSRPSLLMAGSTLSAPLAVIRGAGIPVVANTEWLEPTALARAEWLKYMALFLNEERKAQSAFGAMKARYLALRAQATAPPQAQWPLVMTGRSTRGTFVIAGGRSYVAELIADAGGRYAWTDNGAAATASVDLEAQIRRAASADVWINGGGWNSLAAMLEDEPRYAEFKAYRRGQVWVYDGSGTAAGRTDYWFRSITRPDLVLGDLVKIFHPQLALDRTFEWYSKLGAR
jgi:iron complex transport system substrate-binding protein